jgi:hypothetical protein
MRIQRILLFILLASLACSCAQARTSLPYADRGVGGKTALTLGSVACSAIYTPVKAAYAVGGTLTGGLVFLMSAGQSSTAAGRVMARSTGGDWFVHPDHLTGNRELEFRATSTTATSTY